MAAEPTPPGPESIRIPSWGQIREICDSGDRRLHGFLVYSTSALTVVAFPLGDARAPSVDTSFSSWASLRDVAMSPLYVPLAPALARIAAHCQGGLPTAHAIPVSDGARPSIDDGA